MKLIHMYIRIQTAAYTAIFL